MNQILADAGIRFTNGSIVYDYQRSRGDFVQLRWRDTPENQQKLADFIAERGLSVSDFRFPKEHREDRSLRQRVLEDAMVTTGDSAPRNKADDIRDGVAEYKAWKRRQSWEESTLRAADDAEEAEAAKLSEAERYGRNADQIEHAAFQFLALAFSECPQSEMTAAERRLAIAREGTAAEYGVADAEYRERVRQNALLAQANLQGQLEQQKAQVDAHIQSLQSAAWVDSTTQQEQT